jgi:hypothetical protein
VLVLVGTICVGAVKPLLCVGALLIQSWAQMCLYLKKQRQPAGVSSS